MCHHKIIALFAVLSIVSPSFLVAQNQTPKEDVAESPRPQAMGDAPEWLRGKWVFDEEHTQKKYSEAKPPEGLEAVRHGLVYPQLVEQLKGAQLTVTEKEAIMTTKHGNGKAIPYEVLENAADKSATLKENDGEVPTYHKEGGRVWTASTGNLNIPFYFKRAPGGER
jgi:hypothetical protein